MSEAIEKSPTSKSYTLADFIGVFIKFKRRILIGVLIAGVLSGLFAFLVVEPVFLSEATVKSSKDASNLAGLLGGGLPDIGEFSDFTGGSGAKELALYETILYSRRCVEETIIRFNLNSEDEMNHKYMQDAVKDFKENMMAVGIDKISGTLTIGVFHKNPEKAKEIAQFLVEELNKINMELSVQDAKNNREFIEQRYELVQKDLKRAEDSLKVFQEIYGIAPDITVQAALKSQVEIEALIASEEVKLDLLRKILSPDQAEIKAQEEKIASLRRQVYDIQSTDNLGDMLSLKGKPQVLIDYLRIKRSVEIQNKILSFVLPLYEQAKIEENKNTPSVLVMDPPVVPERKAKPKRSYIVFGAMFFVGFCIYFYSFVYSEIYLKAKAKVK
jgi:tyrosine-protein kinase Etk/Wzc